MDEQVRGGSKSLGRSNSPALATPAASRYSLFVSSITGDSEIFIFGGGFKSFGHSMDAITELE